MEGGQQITYEEQEEKSNKQQQRNIRDAALREAAITMSAQEALRQRLELYLRELDGGTAKQVKEGNATAIPVSESLDRTFNFALVMKMAWPEKGQELLQQHLLPPAIEEASNSLEVKSSGSYLTIADQTYRIYKNITLVASPPNWREYLYIVPPKKVSKVASAYLPRSDDEHEKKLWADAVKEGWNMGVQQAENMRSQQIRQLKRDYIGMLRFVKLKEQGRITPGFVATALKHVQGGGDELCVGCRTLQITDTAALNPNPTSWRNMILPAEEGYRTPADQFNTQQLQRARGQF